MQILRLKLRPQINNAAQTISRPPAYYDALYRGEAAFRKAVEDRTMTPLEARDSAPARQVKDLKTQIVLGSRNVVKDKPEEADPDFPEGARDEHGEQVDLRQRNSWTYNLPEVPAVELLQVILVLELGSRLNLERFRIFFWLI